MENIGWLVGVVVAVYLIRDVIKERGEDKERVSFMMRKKVKR